MPKTLPNIENNWTLFLDRDGVINEEKHNDYIHHYQEFVFYPGVKEAFLLMTPLFKHIFVVTNQRGVGKGITSLENLQEIHRYMQNEIEESGGRIDQVYFCPDVDNESPCRKPNIGMAMQAKAAFPEIDFTKSVMIGNNLSDMQFGRSLNCFTVFLRTTHPNLTNEALIDASYDSLYQFALELVKINGEPINESIT